MREQEIVERLRQYSKFELLGDTYNEAANLIESQQREIAELSKDKERLDWLAHSNYQVQLNSVTNRYEIKPCSHYDADNIRQAIDHARKEQPK